MGSTTVALPQLVDLALNCPEMGSLNFTVLHTLLRIIIEQIGRTETTVEFKGHDSEKIQNLVKIAKPSKATTSITEYLVSGGGVKKKRSKKSLTDLRKEEELKVIERRKNSKDDPSLNPEPMKSPPDLSDGSLKNVVVVESTLDATGGAHFNLAATTTQFIELDQKVSKLQSKYNELAELPSNFNLMQSTRDDKPKPILDMFQILTITKRMDANEDGMQKMASLVEDLAREQAKLAQNPETFGQATTSQTKIVLEKAEKLRTSIDSGREPLPSASTPSVKSLERRVGDLEKAVSDLNEGGVRRGSDSDERGSSAKSKKKSKSKEDVSSKSSKGTPKTSQTQMKEGGQDDDDYDGGASKRKTSHLDDVNLSKIPSSEAMDLIQQEFQVLQSTINPTDLAQLFKDVEEIKALLSGDSDADNLPPQVKINQMEGKFTECVEQLNSLNDAYNGQINLLQNDLTNVQNEMATIMERMNTLLPGGDSTGLNEQSTLDMYQNYVQLQEEVNAIAETANKLIEEKEEREKAMEAILEQIDVLKIVKANREDLEDALGDKADACMINRKVSHDQFEAACDDLAKGIDDALRKLTQQEEMWQLALDEIQREIGNKLDKVEVDPLKDFVTTKLKSLHEKFKALAALKKEQEAAGTKSKFLRDVNCISCDKDVIMRKEMDSSLKPKAPALPPSRNMAPYLAYELDQLRKQQKCIPGAKNLNYFENAIKGGKGPKDKDHICNRYCGGSHTTTTPQQRVTRLGHFLDQWGPDVAPPDSDEYIRGLDNHMYKGKEEPPKRPSKDLSGIKINTKASLMVQGDILGQKLKSSDDLAPTKDLPPIQEVEINVEAEEILTETGGVKPERTSKSGRDSITEDVGLKQPSLVVESREVSGSQVGGTKPPSGTDIVKDGSKGEVAKESSKGEVVKEPSNASGVNRQMSASRQGSAPKVSSSSKLLTKSSNQEVAPQASENKISESPSKTSKPRIAFEEPIPEE